jgi:hypothetical protein
MHDSQALPHLLHGVETPISEQERTRNRTKSQVRAKVEQAALRFIEFK